MREEEEDMARKNPVLVHCITNYVTVNDCANALLAVGARPVMSHAPQEAMEITGGSDALVLNLGATEYYDAMELSLVEAGRRGIPVVLDPVGVSASSFRRAFCRRLLRDYGVTVLKGNRSEVLALMENRSTAAGVDAEYMDGAEREETLRCDVCREEVLRSDTGREDELRRETAWEEAMKKFAAKLRCVVVCSGEEDLITDGNLLRRVKAGTPMLGRLTGTGCMSACLIGAFLAGAGWDAELVDVCSSAMELMGRAGEKALSRLGPGEGLGTYHIKLLDALTLSQDAGR